MDIENGNGNRNENENENKTLHKMLFIMNALEKGWKVKKRNENYIFTKKHENKRKIFKENYLENFILTNLKNGNNQTLFSFK